MLLSLRVLFFLIRSMIKSVLILLVLPLFLSIYLLRSDHISCWGWHRRGWRKPDRDRHDRTYLVPHPWMVATGISQQCQRCYPRFQHLLESCAIFILMSFLWNFQEWVHLSRKTIVPDALQIPYRFGFIRNDKPTTFQQSHQICLYHVVFREVR